MLLWQAKWWEEAAFHVCGARGIEGVRGRHEAAAEWRPYWPGEGDEGGLFVQVAM